MKLLYDQNYFSMIHDDYPFFKFWEMFIRQERCSSIWDASRTDMDVFIRRTLHKWYSGKYFQIREEDWKKRPNHIIKSTKYIHIGRIRFAFGHSHEIVFEYLEPHSLFPQKRELGHNDFLYLSVVPDEIDFAVLSKFYPVEIAEKPKFPTIFGNQHL